MMLCIILMWIVRKKSYLLPVVWVILKEESWNGGRRTTSGLSALRTCKEEQAKVAATSGCCGVRNVLQQSCSCVPAH